jgi:TonB family protein
LLGGFGGFVFGRRVGLAIIGFLCSAAAPSNSIEPLKPDKAWVVDFATAECNAQRAYGNPVNPIILGLRPSAWGSTYELMLITNERGPVYAEEKEGWVDFGQAPIKAWLLHYGVTQPKPYNFFKFRISAEQMAQARSASTVTFHISGRPEVSLTLTAIRTLLESLDRCTNDLQHYWNMTDTEQKKISASAQADLRAIFNWQDYPQEAMSRRQEGMVQFLLFVDEKGKLAACHVLKPSGIPVLDGMGCQVIGKRAKFKPALDSAGAPIRSSIVTPPIVWRMGW